MDSLIRPFDVPYAEWEFVPLLPVECYAFAALAVPRAFSVRTIA